MKEMEGGREGGRETLSFEDDIEVSPNTLERYIAAAAVLLNELVAITQCLRFRTC